MVTPLWALCCLLLIPLGARADRADTTIADQTYALLPAADLLSSLQRAQGPIHLRATAVVGPLYAPTAGLDTVRVSFQLDDVFFLDEVTLNNVVFLGPVQGERTTVANGLSLTNAHFHSAFGLRASLPQGPARERRGGGRPRAVRQAASGHDLPGERGAAVRRLAFRG